VANKTPAPSSASAFGSDHDAPEQLGEFIMGDIAIPPDRPLMGKIAPPLAQDSSGH
jgi:hypothetical protein